MSKKKSSKKSDKEKSSKSDKHRSSKDTASITKKESSKSKKSKSKKSSPKPEKHLLKPTESLAATSSTLASLNPDKSTARLNVINALNLGYDDDDDSDSDSTDKLAKSVAQETSQIILPEIVVTKNTEVHASKSKLLFKLSPNKPPVKSDLPLITDQKLDQNSPLKPGNAISIKSFSIKKVASLSARSALIGNNSKKLKKEANIPEATQPDLPNVESTFPAETTSLDQLATTKPEVKSTTNETPEVKSITTNETPEVKSTTTNETPVVKVTPPDIKVKPTEGASKSRRRKSRSPRSIRRKHRSKSRSKSRSKKTAASTNVTITPVKVTPATPSVVTNTPPTEPVAVLSSSSRRSTRSKPTPSKRSRSRSVGSKSSRIKLKKSKESVVVDVVEEKKVPVLLSPVPTATNTTTTKVPEVMVKTEIPVVKKTVDIAKPVVLKNEQMTEEQNNRARTESNLKSSRDRNHGSHSSSHRRHTSSYNSSRSKPHTTSSSRNNNNDPHRRIRKRKYRDLSSRSRSRTYSPAGGGRRASRSTSRTLSRSSRSASYSSSYSSSSAYSSKREPRSDKKRGRSRTKSVSTQQSNSHRGSGYHQHHHNQSRYYPSSYRSNYYNQASGQSGSTSSGRYYRSNSASKNEGDQHMGAAGSQMFLLEQANGRTNTNTNPNTLRHVKTDGDMSVDHSMQPGMLGNMPFDNNNNNMGFYRGHQNNSQMINNNYRMSRGLQRGPYNNQNIHNVNNRRYVGGSSSGFGMGCQGANSMGQGFEMGASALAGSNLGVGNEANMSGFEITMGTVADLNLDDIQNDANNQSEDSEFEYSSGEETTYYQDGQVFNKSEDLDWSIIQQPRFAFIKNHATTMFDSVFNTDQNLAHKNLDKLATIFGSEQSYLKLVRQELSGADLNNDSNNFILVNCLLNKSFSKIRLGQFFNALNDCPEPKDKTRITYINSEVERRQKLIDDSMSGRSGSSGGGRMSNGSNGSTSCLDECMDLLTKEGLLSPAE